MTEKRYNFALREDQTFVRDMVEAFNGDVIEARETVKEKIEYAMEDMSAHSYNNYTDDSEYTMCLTVKELNWLYDELYSSEKQSLRAEGDG